jgi:NAD(P)-dependent dehydrogenase (short-subunit alcohol dehydrogenase family)
MFTLDQRRALVTGGGSGIGEATAMALASRGAAVIIADRDEVNGRRVASAIAAGGGIAAFVPLDVADETSCADASARATAGGPIDILVNNAGIGHVGTITTTDASDLDRMYSVNVRGVFNMSKACIGGMLERRRGTIVNIASIGGIVGIRDRLAYCTTKFAVVGLTKAMALDHAVDGVRVNCICPGRVETPFVSARLKEYPDPEAAYREMAATQAVGRMGKPGEIAAAVVYLVSDEAAFITGSALIVDGGWSAGK